MERARAPHLLQVFADAHDLVLKRTPVSFDLGLAGAAQKSDTATLAFKMRPAADQAALLVGQMGQFNLEAPFPRLGSFPKNLKNEAGTIQNLDVPGLFQVALLPGGKRMVDDCNVGLFCCRNATYLFYFAGSKKCCRSRFANRHNAACADIQSDGLGKPNSFRQFCFVRTGCVVIF